MLICIKHYSHKPQNSPTTSTPLFNDNFFSKQVHVLSSWIVCVLRLIALNLEGLLRSKWHKKTFQRRMTWVGLNLRPPIYFSSRKFRKWLVLKMLFFNWGSKLLLCAITRTKVKFDNEFCLFHIVNFPSLISRICWGNNQLISSRSISHKTQRSNRDCSCIIRKVIIVEENQHQKSTSISQNCRYSFN